MRTAHELFAAIGMGAFAERARRELIATGEKVRERGVETRDQLTPQEEQIARLTRVGSTDPEIAAQLFLSAWTLMAPGQGVRQARRQLAPGTDGGAGAAGTGRAASSKRTCARPG